MPKKPLRLAWNANYELREVQNPKELVILLHGYQQSGELIYRLLEDCVGPDSVVLAPDAPFPIPQKVNKNYQIAFTWYFFDPETDTYLYDMSIALDYLHELLAELKLDNLPTRIIGYSQGGYLAPFLGERLPQTKQVIGVNCRFRSEALSCPLPFPLDAIHGEKDVLVDPQRASKCHQQLLSQGCRGEFHLLENSGHGISADVRSTLTSLLK